MSISWYYYLRLKQYLISICLNPFCSKNSSGKTILSTGVVSSNWVSLRPGSPGTSLKASWNVVTNFYFYRPPTEWGRLCFRTCLSVHMEEEAGYPLWSLLIIHWISLYRSLLLGHDTWGIPPLATSGGHHQRPVSWGSLDPPAPNHRCWQLVVVEAVWSAQANSTHPTGWFSCSGRKLPNYSINGRLTVKVKIIFFICVRTSVSTISPVGVSTFTVIWSSLSGLNLIAYTWK